MRLILLLATLLLCVVVSRAVTPTPSPGPRTVSIDGTTHEVKNTEVKVTTGQIVFPTVDPHVFNAGYWKDGVLTQSYTPTPTATFTPTPTPTPEE